MKQLGLYIFLLLPILLSLAFYLAGLMSLENAGWTAAGLELLPAFYLAWRIERKEW